MSTAQHYASTLERDGFVVVQSFLDVKLVEEARRDLLKIYETDLEERKRRNDEDVPLFNGSTKTILIEQSHLALRLPGRSRALDLCYEKILTDPMSSELVRRTVGKNFKMRDANCRYMTGARDEGDFNNGPHELHRDSTGEFTIAVILDEVEPGDNGGTEVVPGSHRYPWCPRWDAMFGLPFYLNRKGVSGPKDLPPLGIFNRLLYHFKVRRKNNHGVAGKPGDFYIFLNDTWHGRVPNLNGKRAMVVMAGGFPTDYPFPDEPDPFDPALIEKLPPTWRRIAARDLPPNPENERNSIIHRLDKERMKERPLGLFWWARKEREFMVWYAGFRPRAKAVLLGYQQRARELPARLKEKAIRSAKLARWYAIRPFHELYKLVVSTPHVGPAVQNTWRRLKSGRA